MKQLISLAAGLLLLAAPGAAAQPASPGMASPATTAVQEVVLP